MIAVAELWVVYRTPKETNLEEQMEAYPSQVEGHRAASAHAHNDQASKYAVRRKHCVIMDRRIWVLERDSQDPIELRRC
jgi:hypothetical protein